jgi:hypothetical protein
MINVEFLGERRELEWEVERGMRGCMFGQGCSARNRQTGKGGVAQ